MILAHCEQNSSIAGVLEFASACDLPTQEGSGICLEPVVLGELEDFVNKVVLEVGVNVRIFVLLGRDVVTNVSDLGSAIAVPVGNLADESV